MQHHTHQCILIHYILGHWGDKLLQTHQNSKIFRVCISGHRSMSVVAQHGHTQHITLTIAVWSIIYVLYIQCCKLLQIGQHCQVLRISIKGKHRWYWWCFTSGSQSSPTISSNPMVSEVLLIVRILDWVVWAIFLGLGLLWFMDLVWAVFVPEQCHRTFLWAIQ